MISTSVSDHHKINFTSIDRRTLKVCKVLQGFVKVMAQSMWTAVTATDDFKVLHAYAYPDLRDRLLELKGRLMGSSGVPGSSLQFRRSVFGQDAFGRSFCYRSDTLRP